MFENNKRFSIYSCTAIPNLVELKLVTHICFCGEDGVTAEFETAQC